MISWVPWMQSSIYMKLRVCLPSPQISISLAAGELGGDDLAADGRRRLFPAAVAGAVRAVDIVIAGDAGLQAEVLAEVAAHALAEQLLPAVAVLGHGRIGVALLQRHDIGDSSACPAA